MNNIEFTKKCIDAATNYKTLYVMGCFGAPLNTKNKQRYCNNHSYNKDDKRTQMIQAASEDTFGFDCVCFIKGILWGWRGDLSKTYGGAAYKSNNVPDIGADSIIKVCEQVSSDFTSLIEGELVWMQGHVGVYVGQGLVVECTPKWKNCVQFTACNRDIAGYNRRNWVKHGKLPYIDYIDDSLENLVTPPVNTNVTNSSPSAFEYKIGQGLKNQQDTKIILWNALMKEIGNEFGVAGLMGNIRAESAFLSNNLQNSYESRLGYSDSTYTHAINIKQYTKEQFIRDSAGYGLAQWTYWARKQALYEYLVEHGYSIDDTVGQIYFLIEEIKNYKKVWPVLQNAKSIREASNAVLIYYEAPNSKYDINVQNLRCSYSEEVYAEFTSKEQPVKFEMNQVVHLVDKNDLLAAIANIETPELTILGLGGGLVALQLNNLLSFKNSQIKSINSYKEVTQYKVSIKQGIKYYEQPDYASTVKGVIQSDGIFNIVAEQNNFGKLMSGAGWVPLQSVKTI